MVLLLVHTAHRRVKQMREVAAKWLEGQSLVGQNTCPGPLLPKYGPHGIEWPDVCHCPVNGGAAMEVHELQSTCVHGVEHLEDQCRHVVDGVEQPPVTWVCTCPDNEAHLANCPFDHCPIGQCHPMCAQVTGGTHVIGHESGEALYCHCPCHG